MSMCYNTLCTSVQVQKEVFIKMAEQTSMHSRRAQHIRSYMYDSTLLNPILLKPHTRRLNGRDVTYMTYHTVFYFQDVLHS